MKDFLHDSCLAMFRSEWVSSSERADGPDRRAWVWTGMDQGQREAIAGGRRRDLERDDEPRRVSEQRQDRGSSEASLAEDLRSPRAIGGDADLRRVRRWPAASVELDAGE